MKRGIIALLLATGSLCSGMAWSAAYTWTDEEGVVHFSDAPPETGAVTMLRFDEHCALKQEVDEANRMGAVVILGTRFGGMDDLNRKLVRTRLVDKYRSLALPLHDLEEYCKGGDEIACACLSSIVDRPDIRKLRR